MSIEEISIGNDLRDSFKPTAKWINNGINWVSDIEEFYCDRAIIEKEYASKLLELCKKNFDKKAKISTLLSVGDEPQITPGSLESASLVLWNEVLTQTEAIAEEKVQFSKEINKKLGDNFLLLKNKTGRIAKHIESIDEYLVSGKTKTEDEVNKTKKHYDSLCESTESARQKTEKSSSDKHQQKLQEKEVAMNIGKNEYLIKINIANRLKDKYFYQDVPELLDYFQELNESRVGLLNKLLKNASIIERNSNDRIKEKLHTIDSTIDQNNPKLDVAMFIKHNAYDWKEPQDFYFIPCAIWHDDESLITKEPELTELKRRLNACSSEISRYEDLCIESKQSLEEMTTARKAELINLTLKFDTKFTNSLLLLQSFLKTDSERVKNEVEIEVIQNFAGDKDLSYVEVREKKKSRFGFLHGKKLHGGGGAVGNDNGSDGHSLHRIKSVSSQKSHAGLFNIRRNRGQSNASSMSSGSRGKALYQYDATGDDEVSVTPGEQFDIVDEDDGSGWTMIRTNQGGEGLVPTAYIEVTMAAGASSTSVNSGEKKKGPSVAPKRGAKRVQYVEALYDYQADGDDELTISAGDRIVLVQADTDGSGWTEGELNGATGMFPTSYVKEA